MSNNDEPISPDTACGRFGCRHTFKTHRIGGGRCRLVGCACLAFAPPREQLALPAQPYTPEASAALGAVVGDVECSICGVRFFSDDSISDDAVICPKHAKARRPRVIARAVAVVDVRKLPAPPPTAAHIRAQECTTAAQVARAVDNGARRAATLLTFESYDATDGANRARAGHRRAGLLHAAMAGARAQWIRLMIEATGVALALGLVGCIDTTEQPTADAAAIVDAGGPADACICPPHWPTCPAGCAPPADANDGADAR